MFQKGLKCFLNLESGEIVKLTTLSDTPPKTNVSANQFGATVYTNYSYMFELKEDDLKKMSTSPIVFVRYPDTAGGTSDFTVEQKATKKFYKKVVEGAICIQSNL